jgi:hypothetical protein
LKYPWKKGWDSEVTTIDQSGSHRILLNMSGKNGSIAAQQAANSPEVFLFKSVT